MLKSVGMLQRSCQRVDYFTVLATVALSSMLLPPLFAAGDLFGQQTLSTML